MFYWYEMGLSDIDEVSVLSYDPNSTSFPFAMNRAVDH